MRPMLAILVVSISFLSPAMSFAGPWTICTKYEVVRLNTKLHGCVLDYTDNHRKDNRIWSESLCSKRDLYVYLPPGYDPAERYPLMIWMHGMMQDEKDFLDLVCLFDQAVAAGQVPPMIIAVPDGSIQGRPTYLNAGSFWINSRAGKFEDYIVYDVWNFMVTNFPIRPEPEAHVLAGGSMGGFGAYNLGIKHRERFKHVAGFMPPLHMRYLDCRGHYFANFDPNCIGIEERYRPHATIGVFGLVIVNQHQLVYPLFRGSRSEVAASIARENPVEMLEAYDLKPGELNMFVAYGGKDEFNIDAQIESFVYFAKKRGIEPTVIVDPKGRHSTETCVKMFPDFTAWLTPLVKPYAPSLKLCAPCLK
ncbi:MAG: hypothetical protein K8T89_02210 [Planctomycetes bacterium]|nr:hypothetical protein [Planctomycetota bacterium]